MPESDEDTPVRDLEDALRGLRPRAGLDREALMFQAGRASTRRGWGWPLTTASCAALAVVLGLVLLAHPGPRITERVVYLPSPPARTPPADAAAAQERAPSYSDSPDPAPYLGESSLRDHLLRWGLDGLPPVAEPAAPEARETPASLLRGR